MPLLRKLLRRTFYTAAALSTLLLLATLILWPVSYFRLGGATYGVDGNIASLYVNHGRVTVAHQTGLIGQTGLAFDFSAAEGNFDSWSYPTWNTRDSEGRTNFLGLGWLTDVSFDGWQFVGAYIPFSYLALLFSILPLLAFRAIRRHRKLAPVGLCSKCGYDLRAHATGDTCPECGTPVANKP